MTHYVKMMIVTVGLLCFVISKASAASATATSKGAQKASDIETIEVLIQRNHNQVQLALLDEQLMAVAGGTNLIELDRLAVNPNSLAKVLNFEAGIIVQEFFGGNDQPRINIRGSGIQDNPVNRGIQLLQDGMPLNQADGSFIIGLLDPEQAKYVSIFRGANAMRYGATTLGGAINFSRRNALNSQAQIKLESGSYGYQKASSQLGYKHANVDAFISAGLSKQDGWRSNSQAQRQNAAFNVGFDNGSWKNRTYVDLVDNQFNMPFLLNKAAVLSTPEQVMGEGDTPMDELLDITLRKPSRDTKQWRIANATQFQQGNSHHNLGVYADWTDDTLRNPLTQINTQGRNIGLEYGFENRAYLSHDRLIDSQLFVSANKGELPRSYQAINPINGQLMQPFAEAQLTAQNYVFGGEVSYQSTSQLHWIGSLQWVDNQRKIVDELNYGVLDSDFHYQTINPKFGVIYHYSDNLRFYSNASASSEAPNFWQLATVQAHPHDPLNDHLQINPLSMQQANTFELGFTHAADEWNWQLSWYYSQVDDELISVVGDFAVNGKTINYDGETIHNGVEMALVTQWPQFLLASDHLQFKFVYNYSDFYFADGEYQGKQLAGIPKHYLQLQLDYQISDWVIAFNTRLQPQDTWIDHLNTKSVSQDAYSVSSLMLRYQLTHTTQVYFEVNNVFEQTYQSAYAIRGHSEADLPLFIPGLERSFSAYIKFDW